MYNVIFYDKVKEVVESEEVIERRYNSDGTYTDTVVTNDITRKYRVPTKFVFETATSCDKFMQGFTVIDDFQADMPSLNSAISMFENSSITSISGASGGVADFQSLTSADYMFKNCKQLTSININAPSLVSVEDFINGCESLQSFSGSLESLINGSRMFADFTSLNSFSADLDNLEDGTEMFKNTSLTVFSSLLPSLVNGTRMFADTLVETFNLNCPNLAFADSMFENCKSLNNISINTPLLKTAEYMFKNTSLATCSLNCSGLKFASEMFSGTPLTTFSGDLGQLIIGDNMFASNEDNFGATLSTFNVKGLDNLETADGMMGAVQFEKWTLDMPVLRSAVNMFASQVISEEETIYPALTSFESDLQSLVNGTEMFKDCVNLTSFNAALPSLQQARDMFTNCKLDADSVMYIAETLPYYPETEAKDITIGINCASSNIDSFLSSTGVYVDLADFEKRLYDKGWNLTLVYNPAE